MGRKIESRYKREEKLFVRQNCVFKKANELAILCDAQVAVITFNETGNMANFSSTDMQQILARYRSHLEKKEGRGRNVKCKQQDYSKVVHDLKEISNFETQHQGLLNELSSMSVLQLSAFEHEVTEKLLSIQERKEQLEQQSDVERLEQIKQKNETTHRQVDATQGFSPCTSYAGVAAQLLQPTLQSRLGIDLNVEPDADESDREIQPEAGDSRLSSCVYQSPEPTNSEIQASNSEMWPAVYGGSFSNPHPAFNYSVWP